MSKFLRFDCVVVEGGSAGGVLAARLSEDANRSVLLLEAAPTFRPGEAPQSVRRRCLDHARRTVGGGQSNRHLDGRDRRRSYQGAACRGNSRSAEFMLTLKDTPGAE